jgi:N-acyl-D-amino-acid deacylase
MTSFHGRFHMGKRRLIAPGYAADLVVFDPETILDMSINEDPNHLPEGISHVLLNGTKVVESGARMGTGEVKVIGKEN